jgi:pyruvate dehydrogenase E2 component (dihydrolipoyllysine-residue acetyltransferase)
MTVEVILPRVDMDMSTGKISKWLARVGDKVSKGAVLFEIETDKAAMEIDAPADGILHNILVPEGASAPVGSAVAYIVAEGEIPAAPPTRTAKTEVAAEQPASAAVTFEARAGGATPRATPQARRLAKNADYPLSAVKGSGPRGRIVAADVKDAIDSRSATAASPNDQFPAPSQSGEPVQELFQAGSFDVRPIDGMRRTIAARLTLSKQTIPHFYLSVTCTLDRLMAARQSLNASAPLDAAEKPIWKLSFNDFIVKAFGVALQNVPAANVTWARESILQHKSSDVGVAVAVEGGLFTPVVRNIESKTLTAISAEMKQLAAKARAHKLVPSEYQGGTSTISNLGMFGIEEFTAIINPPHASILAVGAKIERFVPVRGQPALVNQMSCTLSCDHRAIDGVVGAELLQVFRAFIEEPLLLLT